MKKIYSSYFLLAGLVVILFAASCKKDKQTTPTVTNFATIGLYEQGFSNNQGNRVFVNITQVGDVTVSYPSVFDTGSTGMTIDATGILPASMITSNGITVTGDSVVYQNITVTSQTAIISYGISGSLTQEYGNLAYATVKVGDSNGNVITKRIPFFLYYKIVLQATGKTAAAHSNDVFGVGSGVSFTSPKIASPISYFTMPAGITNGFKLALFKNSSFSTNFATYVPGLLSIGLSNDDLTTAGFIMHPMLSYASVGYQPYIAGSISYSGTTIPATFLFDTGNPVTSIIENSAVSTSGSALPANTPVTLSTSQGFSYTYTTTAAASTVVDNPSTTKDIRSIFSIDFFSSNEYLLDYTNHRIGLKNN